MASERSKNLVGLLVCLGLAFAAPVFGVVVTTVLLRRAFEDVAQVDAQRKAEWLGRTISEAMNGAAGGMVLWLLLMIPSVVFTVRLWRERKTTTA